MRIGMILDKTFPPDPRVENEALTLIESGHKVFLFCVTYSDEFLKENYKGILINRYKSNQITYKLSALAYTLPFYAWIFKPKIKHFIQNNKIEAIHIHDMRIAGSVFEINKKFKLPTILDLHDNFPEVMKEYPHLKKFPGKYIISPKKWFRKEQKFIEDATRVISVSQEFVKTIKDRLVNNTNKVVLVPNSVRKSFYNNPKINQELSREFNEYFVLLYIGDTGLRRGLQTAIEAIPIIKIKIPNILLVIVGNSTTDPILYRQVKDLRIEANVRFEGWKNKNLFPSYIKIAKIGISPLIRSKHHDLAYANKLFQYMSLGLPVLVSDATAQKELVTKTNTGLIHKEKDAIDFTKKVFLMHQDSELYSNFEKNTKLFIENEFHWELTATDLVKMYKNLKVKHS